MRQRFIGNEIAVAKLFAGVRKGLYAGQISRIQPDRRLSRYRSDRGKERLDPVSKAVRLLSYGLSGTFTGKAQDNLIDRSCKGIAVNGGQISKPGCGCLKRLDHALKLSRRFGPASGSTFFHTCRLAFVKARTATFLESFGPACLEINLRCGGRLALCGLTFGTLCVTCRLTCGIRQRIQRAGLICVRLLSISILTCLTGKIGISLRKIGRCLVDNGSGGHCRAKLAFAAALRGHGDGDKRARLERFHGLYRHAFAALVAGIV